MFTQFENENWSGKVRVTVSFRGKLSLTEKAMLLYNKNREKRCLLYFDGKAKQVGIKFTSKLPKSLAVTPSGGNGGGSINLIPFCRKNGLKLPTSTIEVEMKVVKGFDGLVFDWPS